MRLSTLNICFHRTFKIFDDDGSKSLDKNEFRNGIRDYGIVLDRDVVDAAFETLDKDKSGKLDFDEFLVALRVSTYKEATDKPEILLSNEPIRINTWNKDAKQERDLNFDYLMSFKICV